MQGWKLCPMSTPNQILSALSVNSYSSSKQLLSFQVMDTISKYAKNVITKFHQNRPFQTMTNNTTPFTFNNA